MRLSAPVFVILVMLSSGLASAQAPSTGNPAGSGPRQAQPPDARSNTDRTRRDDAPPASVNAPLEAGANSFTEGQVRSRLEEAGFQNVTGLTKDDQGIWRGTAMQNGRSVKVGFDYKARVATE